MKRYTSSPVKRSSKCSEIPVICLYSYLVKKIQIFKKISFNAISILFELIFQTILAIQTIPVQKNTTLDLMIETFKETGK